MFKSHTRVLRGTRTGHRKAIWSLAGAGGRVCAHSLRKAVLALVKTLVPGFLNSLSIVSKHKLTVL